VIKENKIQIQTDFLNRNMIGNDNISMHHPFVQRLIEEYEDMIKIHVSNANKLSFEITDLKKKVSFYEETKEKLMNINARKNEKIEILEYELNKCREAFKDFGNEVKWNQSLVSQKTLQIKVINEKLKKNMK